MSSSCWDPSFQHPKRFHIIQKVLLSCFEVKRPWEKRCGSIHKYSVPKNELIFCPDHWGGLFGPKLCEPSTYVILFWCASKKSRFQTFTQLTPSAKLPCIHRIYMVLVTYLHRLCMVLANQTYERCRILDHCPKVVHLKCVNVCECVCACVCVRVSLSVRVCVRVHVQEWC